MANETWHRQPRHRERPRVPKPGRTSRDYNDGKITDAEPSDNEDSFDDRRLEDAFYARSWPPSTRSGGDAADHNEVRHRCKYVVLLRCCFVQVLQQDLSVRAIEQSPGVQNQAPSLNANAVYGIRAIECGFLRPLCSIVGKIKYRCIHSWLQQRDRMDLLSYQDQMALLPVKPLIFVQGLQGNTRSNKKVRASQSWGYDLS